MCVCVYIYIFTYIHTTYVSELCIRTSDLMCHTCKHGTLGQMSEHIAPTLPIDSLPITCTPTSTPSLPISASCHLSLRHQYTCASIYLCVYIYIYIRIYIHTNVCVSRKKWKVEGSGRMIRKLGEGRGKTRIFFEMKSFIV
jgi:hypothetical protein